MYKDNSEIVKITKKSRTYYCDCCNEKLDTVEPDLYFDDQFPRSDYDRHLSIDFDFYHSYNFRGVICNKCWNLMTLDIWNALDSILKQYSFEEG